MQAHANKSQTIKSPSGPVAHEQSKSEKTFPFGDKRPEVIAQRKLQKLANANPQVTQLKAIQEMANDSYHRNYSLRLQPIQMNGGKGKGNRKTVSVSKPSHSQEEIQNQMIVLWQANPISPQDKLRADYAWNYKDFEGGWCDGWSYVLSVDGDDLAELWEEIDSGERLNSTSKYNACKLARKASLYHIANGTPPTAGSPQDLDYQAANFDLEQSPEDREIWKHDEKSTLKMHVIKAEIKSLAKGQTLRLTSPIHDAAVKRIKDGYIVSETESHGVQKCEKLEEALLILDEWRQECVEKNSPFFNQTMIV